MSDDSNFRYDVTAIDLLKAECNRLHEIWLEQAKARAKKQGRDRMTVLDVQATREDALNSFEHDR